MTRYRVTVDGRTYDVDVDDPRARPVTASISGATYTVDVDAAPADSPSGDGTRAGAAPPVDREPASGETPAAAAGPAETAGEASSGGGKSGSPLTMNAPIPGVVSKVTTHRGQTVGRGDEFLTIEAMKMFNVMRSPWAGKVKAIHVKEGDQVVQGQPLVTVTPR